MYMCIIIINTLQDLITVKFTPIADRDGKTSLIAKGVSLDLVYTLLHSYMLPCVATGALHVCNNTRCFGQLHTLCSVKVKVL